MKDLGSEYVPCRNWALDILSGAFSLRPPPAVGASDCPQERTCPRTPEPSLSGPQTWCLKGVSLPPGSAFKKLGLPLSLCGSRPWTRYFAVTVYSVQRIVRLPFLCAASVWEVSWGTPTAVGWSFLPECSENSCGQLSRVCPSPGDAQAFTEPAWCAKQLTRGSRISLRGSAARQTPREEACVIAMPASVGPCGGPLAVGVQERTCSTSSCCANNQRSEISKGTWRKGRYFTLLPKCERGNVYT